MKVLTGMLLAVLVALTAAVSAEQKQGARAPLRATSDGLVVRGDVRVVFSTGDVALIRDHYAPQHQHLPPGLYKKLARTGTLPPGWQKKISAGEKLDEEIYQAGTVINETDTHEDVQVEDKVIRVIKSTRRIAEILGTE